MGNADWTGYYAAQRGRPPRREFRAALAAVPADAPRCAVDLGAGDGTETAALLREGWRVLSVDPTRGLRDRVVEILGTEPGEQLTVHELSFAMLDNLPRSAFVYAGFSLPFATPAELEHVVGLVADALTVGGRFAAHFFGERDSWAAREDVLTHDQAALRDLLRRFDVTEDGREYDGPSGTGPKHWHVRFVTATRRQPAAD